MIHVYLLSLTKMPCDRRPRRNGYNSLKELSVLRSFDRNLDQERWRLELIKSADMLVPWVMETLLVCG